MSDTPNIPEGLNESDEPRTTTQDDVTRARARWEHDRTVYAATEEVFEQVQPFIARRYYARYKAYVEAGFSVEQAMTLVTALDIEDDE